MLHFSKLSNVFHCTGCDSWVLQPLGAVKREGQRDKFILPKINTPIGQCEHCGLRQRVSSLIIVFFFYTTAALKHLNIKIIYVDGWTYLDSADS